MSPIELKILPHFRTIPKNIQVLRPINKKIKPKLIIQRPSLKKTKMISKSTRLQTPTL